MPADLPSSLPDSTRLATVLGPVLVGEIGITDAHTHVWIDPVAGAAEGSPILCEHDAILTELIEYRQAGGSALIDCQPGGCGRNGQALMSLSEASGVHIVACTGFHRARYYPADYWLWSATAEDARDYFLLELRHGLKETLFGKPIRAGFIKVACEARLGQTPLAALEGAAAAAAESGCALEIHTERGLDAENILAYFIERQVQPHQLVLCHMDKRADAGLHRELAAAGVLLEYDTFYRPKYAPDLHLWPLIWEMVESGWAGSLALATDIAETSLWRFGGGAGLPGILTAILPRLRSLGLDEPQVRQLFGKNIIYRLAAIVPSSFDIKEK